MPEQEPEPEIVITVDFRAVVVSDGIVTVYDEQE